MADLQWAAGDASASVSIATFFYVSSATGMHAGAGVREAVEPETATEERLANMLGGQLVTVVGNRIERLKATPRRNVRHPRCRFPGGGPQPDPDEDVWTLRAAIFEPSRRGRGYAVIPPRLHVDGPSCSSRSRRDANM